MDVATADHGATALELMRAAARAGTPFDIAVIDMKMPIMDGLDDGGDAAQRPHLADVQNGDADVARRVVTKRSSPTKMASIST